MYKRQVCNRGCSVVRLSNKHLEPDAPTERRLNIIFVQQVEFHLNDMDKGRSTDVSFPDGGVYTSGGER